MNLAFSPEEERFRAEVREFLAEHRELCGFFMQDQRWDEMREFFRELGRRGWLSLGWPPACGGRGCSAVWEFILWDEMAYARAARPLLSSGIVAKTLIQHGSDAQRERYLPGIARGELHFSLGYSEPEAGSDLASVRTRAERRGDHYRVSGEKCWTSYAQVSDFLWLLCRTGTQESRGRGLSLMILDLRAPGVTLRPVPMIDDEQLNEIHLDAVAVPVENLVGPENRAWKLMADALAVERHVQFPPGRLRRDLEELSRWLREHGRGEDPRAQHVLSDLAVRVREVEMHALSVLDAMEHGRPSAVEAACTKLSWTETCQRIARSALDLGGPEALVREGGVDLELLWRQSMWETIGGGTSEIMRGLIARQALGLGGGSAARR